MIGNTGIFLGLMVVLTHLATRKAFVLREVIFYYILMICFLSVFQRLSTK